jgi:hypothetical protein
MLLAGGKRCYGHADAWKGIPMRFWKTKKGLVLTWILVCILGCILGCALAAVLVVLLDLTDVVHIADRFDFELPRLRFIWKLFFGPRDPCGCMPVQGGSTF